MSKLKIGLALGGGGAKGFAHLGVIKALHQNKNIEIVQISGTSMGALIGCAYAFKKDYQQIEQDILEKKYLSFIKSFLGLIKFDFSKLHQFCDDFVNMADFSNLQIPVNVIATDINQMKSIVLNSGNVATAVTASSLTPYIHRPFKYKNSLLVDGGMTNLLPIEHANSSNVDLIVGVDVSNSSNYLNKDLSLFKLKHLFQLKTVSTVIDHAHLTTQNEILELKRKYINKPVEIIFPEVNNISKVEFIKASSAIQAGEKAAQIWQKQTLKQYL